MDNCISEKSILCRNHLSCDLEQIFEDCFFENYSVQLLGGSEEPLYLPAASEEIEPPYLSQIKAVTIDSESCAILFYKSDFFASALHEIAHWCIAGKNRREQVDFGYWYVPDGRTLQQQQRFQKAEVKPQALELLFSIASRYSFSASIDNLNSDIGAVIQQQEQFDFSNAVYRQAVNYIETLLPVRANIFLNALAGFYQVDLSKRYFFSALTSYQQQLSKHC
mgnify:CR=1 FL=1